MQRGDHLGVALQRELGPRLASGEGLDPGLRTPKRGARAGNPEKSPLKKAGLRKRGQAVCCVVDFLLKDVPLVPLKVASRPLCLKSLDKKLVRSHLSHLASRLSSRFCSHVSGHVSSHAFGHVICHVSCSNSGHVSHPDCSSNLSNVSHRASRHDSVTSPTSFLQTPVTSLVM